MQRIKLMNLPQETTGRIAIALLERILKPIIEAQKEAVWEQAEEKFAAEKIAATQKFAA